MVTAVWGDWHLRMLFEVNLPTLLAEGNLPALARNCDITYLLFTQRSDFARVSSAPTIRALRDFMDVRIEILDDEDLDNPIAAHHKAWNTAVRRAKRDGQMILLMPPDVAWSNNAFASVGAHLAQGRKAIFMTYLRAVPDGFVPALLARRDPAALANSVPPQEMVRLCVENLHPLMAAYLRSSDHFPYHPEMILWSVPGEGIAARVLAREMFLFDPTHFALNEVSLPADPIDPSEVCFLADSDELFAVSLAPLGKDVAWHTHPRLPDPVEIGGWWLDYDSPVNDFIAGHKIRWHFAPVTPDTWHARERGADLFVRRAAAAREGIRVWHALRELGCTRAAPILALAIHTGSLIRAVRGRGPTLIFAPTDQVLARVPVDRMDELLSPSGAGSLTALIRAHHVPDFGHSGDGEDPLERLLADREEAELTAASGATLHLRRDESDLLVNGLRVTGTPATSGGHAVYRIEGLLADLNMLFETEAKVEQAPESAPMALAAGLRG